MSEEKKHLWEYKHEHHGYTEEYYCEMVEHSYYCHTENYADGKASMEFDSWEDFLVEWREVDLDYNMVFRWDWIEGSKKEDYPKTDELHVFFMLQRKGYFIPVVVKNMKRGQEEEVKEFLQKSWGYMKELWRPIHCDL